MTSREEEILELLQLEDLTDTLQFIAESLGIDVVKQMLRECGGVDVYIPTIPRVKSLVYRYITKEKITDNKRDLQRLARDLNVTSRYLKKIMADYSNPKASA